MRYEQFHIMLTDPEKYPDDCLAIARADSPFWGRRTGEIRDFDHEPAEDETVNITHYEKNGVFCTECMIWYPAAVQD